MKTTPITTPRFVSALLLSALLASPSLALAAPIATVNGVAIPAERVNQIAKQVTSGKNAQKDTPELRKMIKDRLVTAELIAQEASKRGLDKTADFTEEMAATRQRLLNQAFMDNFTKTNAVTDAQIADEYKKATATMGGKEFNLRHIMSANEADAKAVLADLQSGKKFDAVAKAKSTDKASGAKGGSIGWVSAGMFPPAVGEAIQKLGKGQVSTAPVNSGQGWHVFKVDDSRSSKIPPLSEVKDQIKQKILGEKFNKMVDGLKTSAKIQ